MNLLSYISSARNFLINYVEVHCVIMCVSLPCCVAWGLPISIMSIVGNLLIGPCITLFLIISTILFISELLFIPNHYVVNLLEFQSSLIHFFLAQGSKGWLIALPNISVYSALLSSLCIIFIYWYKSIVPNYIRISLLIIVCCIPTISSFLFYRQPVFSKQHIEKNLYLTLDENNQHTLHDNGCFSQKSSPDSFVYFTVRPHLIKTLGTLKIDTLELHRFTYRAVKAAQALATLCNVMTIIIHKHTTVISKGAWRAYYDLKRSENAAITLI